MDANQIKTQPDPFEPFLISQAFRVGDLVITSGQAAITPGGELVGVGDFSAQAEQVFTNLAAVLEAAGSSLSQIIKVTIYLTDMSNFPEIVTLREKYLRIGNINGLSRVDILTDCVDRTCRPVEVSIY